MTPARLILLITITGAAWPASAAPEDPLSAADVVQFVVNARGPAIPSGTLADVTIDTSPEEARALAAGRAALREGTAQVAHVGHTILLLWVIAGVTGALREAHLSPLRKEPTDTFDLLTNAGAAIANDAGLYAALAGAGFAGVTARTVMSMSTPDNLALARAMGAASLSFVTFVGWEAGARLWAESINDLVNDARTPQEREAAIRDVNLALKLPILKIMSGGGGADERRVFGRVMTAALARLVFAKPERTAEWLKNTLRLNILTGRFWTTFLAMTGFGALGGAVAGGPLGATLGFVGGVAGGLAAHYVPDRVNDGLTDRFRQGRGQIAENHLNLNAAQLSQLKGDQLERALGERAGWRDTLVTSLIEPVYEGTLKHQEAEITLAEIDRRVGGCPGVLIYTSDPKLFALEDEFTRNLGRGRRRAERSLEQILGFQSREIEILKRLGAPAQTWVRRVAIARKSVRELYVGLFPEARARLGAGDLSATSLARLRIAANVLLNSFYLKGFGERVFAP